MHVESAKTDGGSALQRDARVRHGKERAGGAYHIPIFQRCVAQKQHPLAIQFGQHLHKRRGAVRRYKGAVFIRRGIDLSAARIHDRADQGVKVRRVVRERVQRDNFVATQRVDGKLILPEAIKILQQKAS